jgi:uncharacterized protein (TIGR03067 family)
MSTTLLVGLALAVGAPGLKDEPKKEASIVGEWVGVKATAGGKDRPVPAGGISFTFTADGKFIVKEGKKEKPDEGTYKLDAKKDPAEIDIMPPAEREKQGKIEGIYKLDGDELQLCFGRGPGAERPKKFESPEGSAVMLMTLKRAKKE